VKQLHAALASLTLAGAVLLLAPVPAGSQSPTAYKAPRTPFGKPDLQGLWSARNTAWGSLEAHGASHGIRAGNSVIVDPADGKIPYTPEALQQREENWKNRHELDPVNKCFLPGVPRLMYMPYPFQIYQTPDYTLVLSEFAHSTRTIYTNGTSHFAEAEFWMGDSRGRWEGETLVVDVAAFNGETWLDMSGNFHSPEMRVVERFTRVAPDEIRYEATITDPQVYTRPWTIRMPLYLHREPDAQLFEYECHVYLEDEGIKTYK
jgi:hypothetical protein